MQKFYSQALPITSRRMTNSTC